MALTRQHLSPLDGYDNRIDWARALERTNQRLLRWVLGTGLLSLHLAVFTTVLLGALTWNLISNPGDLHLLSPFRIWGIAALAHTLLVGGGLIGWRIFMGNAVAPRPVPVYPRRAVATSPPEQAPATGWSQTRSVGSVTRATVSARRWATVQQMPAEPTEPRATGWPIQPGAGVSAPADAPAAESRPDVGEATWPEAPPLSTTLLGTSEARVASDQVVSVDHRAADSAGDDPGRTWVDGFVESRTQDKENRWSWVEAAAASWLSRREVSGPAEKALPASSESSPGVAPEPIEPERRDESSLPN